MAEKKIFVGGDFLISNATPEEVFTPEDFTEEHRMIMDMAKGFVEKEVHPHMDQLEEKDKELTLSLLAKAGELGLLGTDIPKNTAAWGWIR